MGDGDNFLFIRRMIPDVNFDRSASTATKEATVTLKSQRSRNRVYNFKGVDGHRYNKTTRDYEE